VAADAPLRLRTQRLSAFFHDKAAVRQASLGFPLNSVTAIIGPSGCGKSTYLRCLNRMHELSEGASVSGQVLLDEQDIYASGVNPVELRRRVGMVFQRPTPFPTMSIFDNVAAGLRVNGHRKLQDIHNLVEHALHRAGLWDEVKDRLQTSAVALSGGQQQRLCVARAIAPEPEVVLFDEPTASLDPAGTVRIEDLVQDLSREFTVVIVTHNMQQAARVSDFTAFFYLGEMIEHGSTEDMFTNPRDHRTEAYVTGRFG
jgi:phosphate transport system ATP-binding protein